MTPQKDDIEALRSITDILKDFDATEQQRIIRWVQEKLGVSSPPPPVQNPPNPAGTPPVTGPASTPAASVKNLKTFVTEKKPKNDVQFAATVAFFHRFEAAKEERKTEINAEDLVEASRLAVRERLHNPGQTLLNAHKVGLLDRVSRGVFRINSVGENLVAMTLPGDGTTATPAKKKKGKKKPAKKAKK
jgi:hypothetical protein